MSKKFYEQGELLYHVAHGLCYVEKILQQKKEGKTIFSYSLMPKIADHSKMRFIVLVEEIEASGFHPVVSRAEATAILDYLKLPANHLESRSISSENFSFGSENQTWELAKTIRAFSIDNDTKQARQNLDRTVRGLAGELACVFQSSLREAALMIQKSLRSRSQINPLLQKALMKVGE